VIRLSDVPNTRAEIKELQRGLNTFTKRYMRGVGPVRVDGVLGKATKARVRTVKYLLGYRGAINSIPDKAFRERMWHPKEVKYSTRSRVELGKKRRSAHRRAAAKRAVKATISPGVTRYDGVPVAKWMVPYLDWARRNGWRGRLVSGWRDPAYSRSLCYRMCGAPSCAGRCAGSSSNHSGSARPRGAVDVSDYYNFGRVVARAPYSPRLINRLGARDPVHFSASGN
jgi:hypothetical protein